MILKFNGVSCSIESGVFSVADVIHAPLETIARNQARLSARVSFKYYPSVEAKIIAALREIGHVEIVSGKATVANVDEVY